MSNLWLLFINFVIDSTRSPTIITITIAMSINEESTAAELQACWKLRCD